MDDVWEKLVRAIRTLQPKLESRRRTFMTGMIAGTALIVIGVTALVLFTRMGNPGAIVIAGALIPSVLLGQTLGNLYSRGEKIRFLQGLASMTGFSYRPGGAFPLHTAERHQIIPAYDRGRTWDGLEGSYKGLPFALQETHLTNLRQDPAHRDRQREMTVFKGLLICIRLNRPLDGHSVVVPHRLLPVFFTGRFSDYQVIEPASPRFSRLYTVLTTDTGQARVVLSPNFTERLLQAGKTLQARWMNISFYENEIVIAVQRFRPLFKSAPLWEPVTAESMRGNMEELGAVLNLIDVLKLNRQIAA